MKKAISVLLSVLIITASAAAGLTALATDDGLRIAVASDLHYLHTGEELSVLPTRAAIMFSSRATLPIRARNI